MDYYSLICIFIFISFLFILLRRGYKRKVNDILLFLVTKAEKEFGNNTGKLKYSAVTTWIYEFLPNIGQFFITPKELDDMIEDSVQEMKEYLGHK